MLRIVYKNCKSSFAELLSEDKSFIVCQKSVQKLAIEIYKVKDELCPKIMLDLFKEVTQHTTLEISKYMVLTKSKLFVMVQKPLPTLVQKFEKLFQTK